MEVNNGEGGLDDASKMIEQLTTAPAANDFVMPEDIHGIKPEDYEKGLSIISNGAIENFEALNGLVKSQGQLTKIQEDYANLQKEFEANKNTFATPYIKELNELHKKGATPEEINLFKKIQPLDLDGMADVEALKLQMSMQYPNLTKSEVEAAFEEENGVADDWSEGTKAIMAKKAFDAKKELKSIQIDAGKPASVASQEEQAQVHRKKYDYWKAVEKTVGVQETFKISQKLSGDKMFEFDFKLPEGAVKVIEDARLYYLMNEANIKNGDADSYKKQMPEFTKQVVYARYGEQMMAAALEHQASEIKLAQNQKFHNAKPIPEGKDAKVAPINDALNTELDKFRE